MTDQKFLIRQAKHDDEAELRKLIELSVRHLQKNDYSPSQIDGALGMHSDLTRNSSRTEHTSQLYQYPTRN